MTYLSRHCLALVLGTLLAAFRVSPVSVLRWAGATYVTLVRNTPLVIVFAAFFFGLTYGLLQICTERTMPRSTMLRRSSVTSRVAASTPSMRIRPDVGSVRIHGHPVRGSVRNAAPRPLSRSSPSRSRCGFPAVPAPLWNAGVDSAKVEGVAEEGAVGVGVVRRHVHQRQLVQRLFLDPGRHVRVGLARGREAAVLQVRAAASSCAATAASPPIATWPTPVRPRGRAPG